MSKKSKFHIDTVKFRVTASDGYEFKIPGAQSYIRVDDDGVCYDTLQKFVGVSGGEYRGSVQVSSPDSGRSLVIEGSLPKFLYGQNVYSSQNLTSLVLPALRRVCNSLGFKIPVDMRQRWECGDIDLLGLHVAVNFMLESKRRVGVVLTALQHEFVGQPYQNAGHGTSILLSPNHGKCHRIGFYGKHDEMSSRKRRDESKHMARLRKECDGILRVEVRVRGAELDTNGLGKLEDWTADSAKLVFVKYFDKYADTPVPVAPVTEAELNALPDRLAPFYLLHKSGVALPLAYRQRQTVRRALKEFREHGIDLKQPNNTIQKVTMLSEVLSGKIAATTPDWMIAADFAPGPTQ